MFPCVDSGLWEPLQHLGQFHDGLARRAQLRLGAEDCSRWPTQVSAPGFKPLGTWQCLALECLWGPGRGSGPLGEVN